MDKKNGVVPIKAVEHLAPTNQSRDNGQCVVSGVYAFVLRLSSVSGMAPLRFKRLGNGYTVSLSHYMCIYSYLLVTALAMVAVFAITLDLALGAGSTEPIVLDISQIMLTCDVTIAIVIMGIAVYGAPGRMRNMFNYMKTMATVDNSMSALYSHSREYKLWAALICFLLLFTAMLVQDIYNFLISSDKNKSLNRKFVHHVLRYLITVLEIQFAYTALAVQLRLKAVNDALSLTARELSLSNTQKDKPSEEDNIFHVKMAPTETQSEKIVIIRKSATGELCLAVSPSDAVYRIGSLHGELSYVVHLVENCFSVPLIVILASTLLQLIVSPYFTVMEISSGNTNNLYFIILEFFWIILLVLRLFMVVEPCNATILEGKATESVVSRMLLASPTSGPLHTRLELLSRQLMLISLCYNPLGLCIFDRQLIASIFGAVTTYLVIFIQFQKTDIK